MALAVVSLGVLSLIRVWIQRQLFCHWIHKAPDPPREKVSPLKDWHLPVWSQAWLGPCLKTNPLLKARKLGALWRRMQQVCYVCLVYGLKKNCIYLFFGTTVFPGEVVRMVLEPIPANRLDADFWGELNSTKKTTFPIKEDQEEVSRSASFKSISPLCPTDPIIIFYHYINSFFHWLLRKYILWCHRNDKWSWQLTWFKGSAAL